MRLFDFKQKTKTVQCLNKKCRVDGPELFQGLKSKYYISRLRLWQESFFQSAIQTLSMLRSPRACLGSIFCFRHSYSICSPTVDGEKWWLVKWNVSINSFQNKAEIWYILFAFWSQDHTSISEVWHCLSLNHLTWSKEELSVGLSPPTQDTHPLYCIGASQLGKCNLYFLSCT